MTGSGLQTKQTYVEKKIHVEKNLCIVQTLKIIDLHLIKVAIMASSPWHQPLSWWFFLGFTQFHVRSLYCTSCHARPLFPLSVPIMMGFCKVFLFLIIEMSTFLMPHFVYFIRPNDYYLFPESQPKFTFIGSWVSFLHTLLLILNVYLICHSLSICLLD